MRPTTPAAAAVDIHHHQRVRSARAMEVDRAHTRGAHARGRGVCVCVCGDFQNPSNPQRRGCQRCRTICYRKGKKQYCTAARRDIANATANFYCSMLALVGFLLQRHRIFLGVPTRARGDIYRRISGNYFGILPITYIRMTPAHLLWFVAVLYPVIIIKKWGVLL